MSDRDERRRARIEAERARRRKSRRRKRSKTPLIAGAAAVTAVVIAGGAIALTRDDGPGAKDTKVETIGRAGSSVVKGAADVDIARTPDTVRVVYRVETAGEETSVVTDVLTSKRPFESRLDTRDGEPPGGDVFSSRVGWFLHTATVTSSQQQPSIIEVAPGLPPTDLRLETVLPVALQNQLVEKREVRRVVDRECQIYRSRQTLAAIIQPPTAAEHTDTCVDAAGLVLEEVVTVDGSVLTRRVAIEVDDNATIEDASFVVDGKPLEAAGGGGFVRKVKDGSTPPGEFFVLDRAPEGFEYVGRYSVVPPQPENFTKDDPTRESFRRAGVVDAWRKGAELVVVDQGGTLRGGDAFEPTAGVPKIDVGPFGEGELLLSGAGVEVRAKRDGGRYLRVYGTLPPDQLVAIAARLRAVEGGTLELEDQ